MPFWQQQLREEISLAQVIPERGLRPAPPLGPCFLCNQSGHWAKACPNPWPPTKLCPTCGQWGHWKMDCPHLPDLESGMSTGMPWRLWGNPHFSPEPQPNPTRVVPMTGPGFQPPGPVPNTSSELRVDGVLARKKISFIVDTGATFS